MFTKLSSTALYTLLTSFLLLQVRKQALQEQQEQHKQRMQEKHRRRVDRLSRQEQEEQEGQEEEEEEELVPGDSISNQGEEGTDDAKLRRISTAERRLVRRELQHQSQPMQFSLG